MARSSEAGGSEAVSTLKFLHVRLRALSLSERRARNLLHLVASVYSGFSASRRGTRFAIRRIAIKGVNCEGAPARIESALLKS